MAKRQPPFTLAWFSTAMKKNERLLALKLLLAVLEDKKPLSSLLSSATEISPLGKEICFGVCRYYYQLNALAKHFLRKKPKAMEIWVVLLMGLYQLHYMRQPDYAVVKETVALLDHGRFSWGKGLINAVLRQSIRQHETLPAQLNQQKEYQFNHPEWLIERIKASWPNDWQNILHANNGHPPMSLRVNRLKISRENYLSLLQERAMDAEPHPFAPEALILSKPCDVHDLPGFAEGLVSVQDVAAQLAAALLQLKPGLRVLDACCAPGGKTCHLLELEPQLADCMAIDVDKQRLKKVQDNLSRLQLNAQVVQANALSPEDWWDGQTFDRILLDAPCSATGVIRRHPDIKLLRQAEEIQFIRGLQQQLLQSLWPLLAPGGIMVYATCSILPEENEQQIASFIAQQQDCRLLSEPQPWGQATGHGWQILPNEQRMDGFFYSILYKETI